MTLHVACDLADDPEELAHRPESLLQSVLELCELRLVRCEGRLQPVAERLRRRDLGQDLLEQLGLLFLGPQEARLSLPVLVAFSAEAVLDELQQLVE